MKSSFDWVQEAFEHQRTGNTAEAEGIFDGLLAKLPEDEPALLYGYGTLLLTQDKVGLGILLLKRAIELEPDFVPAIVNLGVALKKAGRYDAALSALKRAEGLAPDDANVLSNIAGVLVNQASATEVVAYAKRALEADPNNPHVHMHLALGLLEQGRYAEAWPSYQHRWELPERLKDRRPYAAPPWDGSRVATLAVHGEQGLGDEIMYMGCLRALKERADRVVIECAPRLAPLFRRSLGVHCYGTHAELTAAEGEPDAFVPMGSLPMFTGIPDGLPYLSRETLRSRGKPRVGLAWKGGTGFTNAQERSIGIETLRPLLTLPGFDFASIQYGPEEVREEAAAAGLLLPHGQSFDDLVAATERCDFVVSVCQTAVHLAGAMGIPTFVLTPHRKAWRYVGSRPSSWDQSLFEMDWYRSATLVQQGPDEAWGPVIARIAGFLRQAAAQSHAA